MREPCKESININRRRFKSNRKWDKKTIKTIKKIKKKYENREKQKLKEYEEQNGAVATTFFDELETTGLWLAFYKKSLKCPSIQVKKEIERKENIRLKMVSVSTMRENVLRKNRKKRIGYKSRKKRKKRRRKRKTKKNR